MPTDQPDFDSVRSSSKAALNNASEAIDLMMSKSAELLELNLTATKDNVKRQTVHLRKLKETDGPEELVHLHDKYAQGEQAAAAKFSSDIYALATGACADLSSLSDNSRNLSGDFLTDSLEAVANAIPQNAPQPFGSVMQQILLHQMEVCRSCGEIADKAYRAQRESFSSIVKAVEEAAPSAAKGRGKS